MKWKEEKLRYDRLGLKVAENLKKRHFDAYYAATKEEAVELFFGLIPQEHIVSWGGTMTMEELGLKPLLRERGYQVIDRDTAKSPEERVALMRQALLCDTFVMSSNAISADGQLVNIDGNGNRVAAMCFGPKSVIVIAGMNKVAATYEDALARARKYAAPLRSQSFPDSKNPCLMTGDCVDCTALDCNCAYVVTTRISRPAKKIKVILVGEDLGF